MRINDRKEAEAPMWRRSFGSARFKPLTPRQPISPLAFPSRDMKPGHGFLQAHVLLQLHLVYLSIIFKSSPPLPGSLPSLMPVMTQEYVYCTSLQHTCIILVALPPSVTNRAQLTSLLPFGLLQCSLNKGASNRFRISRCNASQILPDISHLGIETKVLSVPLKHLGS